MLARVREQRRQNEIQQLARPSGDAPPPAPVAAQNVDVEQILADAGIDARVSPALPNREPSPAVQPPPTTAPPKTLDACALEMTETQQITILTREITNYSKTTQTDDEARYSGCEFSLGSQEFAFDEYSEGERHDIDFDESPTREIQNFLPHLSLHKINKDEPVEERQEDQRVPEFSEEEKKQILNNPGCIQFVEQAVRVIERVLGENEDVYVDYAHDATLDDRTDNGEKLVKTREFYDEKWTEGRYVTALDCSDLHPELIAVAYSENKAKPLDPEGVVEVWNTKFKKQTPEYTFFSPSKIRSLCFARFHPNLILGGCYSGQICMWDNRRNKKTPVNKSPLSQTSHTHPIYCLKVIGSQNAHQLISVSTDGRLCYWNIENLNEPIGSIDIQSNSAKGKQVPVISMSFAPNEVNNFVVGSEEGIVYPCSRHDQQKNGVIGTLEGEHKAPVSAVDVYRASNQLSGDNSHLFLSSSVDWSIKLWSLKDEKKPMLRSFDKHGDYVMDVAWHPSHPSVFASVDASGYLFLWNINEDLESPVAVLYMGDGVALRKLMWTENGKQLVLGDDRGKVHIYDVHDNISNVKSEEHTRFNRTLREIHRAALEADEAQGEEFSLPRVSSGVGAAMGNGIAAAAVPPSANVSPRQQY
uniref:WD_REPEATS_REGION domain-containing protein n=1 Tax=Steinernema glaseri TaxID=37863 RepID=A0A1I7Y5M7_9BILA